jgi:beta-glucanase (GH16 family)
MSKQRHPFTFAVLRPSGGRTGSHLMATGLLMMAVAATAFTAGCGGGSNSGSGGGGNTTPAATPSIATTAAQNGAVIITLADATSGATIYFTTDGSTPTTSSQVYEAPFLVDSNLIVKAMATAAGDTASSVASQTFSSNVPSGTLVWSDEFANSTSSAAQPDSKTWTYDTGAGGWGNNELEDYCAWGSSTAPCDSSNPNAYVGTDGSLHIVARDVAGQYTSARLKTEGLFSFQYGRFEVKAKVPEAQGFWPAAWLLGNNIATVNWPACGEMDVMERIDAAGNPDWNAGSIHGTGFTGGDIGTQYDFPPGQTAADWHTYGMIWSKDSVAYYIDDPTKPYATFTPSSISGFSGSAWPFNAGPNFIILNLAVGGGWPGNPDSTTPFPSEMVVDYVRIYTN